MTRLPSSPGLSSQSSLLAPPGSRPEVQVLVPPGWRRRRRPEHGVVVAARAPYLPASGVRPELVLRCTAQADDDLHAWRADALATLAATLDDLALEDDAELDLDGHAVLYHRFAHRVLGRDLLCDQWSWLVAGWGVVLTCSADRDDYGTHCDLFEQVAESVELLTGE